MGGFFDFLILIPLLDGLTSSNLSNFSLKAVFYASPATLLLLSTDSSFACQVTPLFIFFLELFFFAE